MAIPGEQIELAVPSDSSPVRRRLAAQYVRDARDRLISTTGTRPFFDLELLRQYAQTRISASLVILLLVGTIGFLYRGRGTVGGLKSLVNAAAKCDCDVTQSPNVLLLPDDSEFMNGTGNWAGIHDLTDPKPTGTGMPSAPVSTTTSASSTAPCNAPL
jgi:hypothetical protein